VACAGATPCWYLATVLLPEGKATRELAEAIFSQTSRACRQLGVAWCGGHTEVVHGLPRPIVVGQMLGEVGRDQYLTAAGAKVGDALILTKGIALEGAALIAREKADEARNVLSAADLQRCANLLHEPGVSVVNDARLAIAAGGVHALHDPTEGGLATGLWELAQAAGVGLVVDEERLPLLPKCKALCGHFKLDPLGLIASGSLLIAADTSHVAAIIERLQVEGTAATAIGEVSAAEQGCRLRQPDGSTRPLPTFAADEITRLFAD
jgi:hydrogenase expression/formation protein HypE